MLFRSSTRAIDRPHWAARIEDASNRIAATALTALRWQIRIQPYVGYGSTSQVHILAKLLYARPGTPADYHDQPIHDMRTMAIRGFRSFGSQCAPFARVTMRIGDRELRVRADRSGIVDALIDVALPPGRHTATLTTDAGAAVTADVHVYDPEQPIGVVSDIDDTVMVTWLPRPLLAAWNAFIVEQSTRRPVAGMAVLYQEIAREHPGAPFIYLSTGAWNVFPVVRRFLFKNGFPEGPLLMTDWGPTNTGLFRSGMEHKLRSLDALATMLPGVRWVLVGDDGQHDPEIYSTFDETRPGHVALIALRQLTEAQQLLAHGSRTARRLLGRRRSTAEDSASAVDHSPAAAPVSRRESSGTLHIEAPDGFGLADQLRRAGFIPWRTRAR